MLAQRPGPLPQGWLTRRIGEFATECKHRAGHRTDLPVFSVTKHHGIVRSDRFFSKRVHGENTSNYKVVHPGQFAYATIHLNEGSIGKLRGSTSGIVSPMYTVFDVHDGIEPDYLFAVLKSRQSLRVYEKITQGTVNRRGGISFRTLSGLVLHHPPLPEQRKIAAILSSMDDTIEETQAVIDQMQVVKRGLMQELLTRGLPGRHKRFKRTEFGEVPEGWIEADLGSVLELKRGYDLPKRDRTVGTVPVVSSSGATGTHREARVKGPGVVTGRYGNIGQVFFVPDDFWPLNTTLYVRDFKGNDPRFISHFLRALDFSAHSGKTAVPGVNRNHLHRTRIVFPPDVGEQGIIAAILSSVDDAIEQTRSLIGSTQVLKSAFMSVLLTGELRVTPNDETT